MSNPHKKRDPIIGTEEVETKLYFKEEETNNNREYETVNNNNDNYLENDDTEEESNTQYKFGNINKNNIKKPSMLNLSLNRFGHGIIENKFSAITYQSSTLGELPSNRPPTRRDYDKATFSSAVRRLANKTQVFPLVKNDFVHTRFSHSQEASCVGANLAALLAQHLIEPDEDKETIHRIEDVVRTASLLHDIGNPPFGHRGEMALREWWNNFKPPIWFDAWTRIKDFSIFKDFHNFEGNAHGIRLMLKKIQKLSLITIATFIKYPQLVQSNKKHFKKSGVYFDDIFKLAFIAKETKMKYYGEYCFARHPLNFIVEAADDICYNIIDLEDAAHMKVISSKKAIKLMFELICSLDFEKAKKIILKKLYNYLNLMENNKKDITKDILNIEHQAKNSKQLWNKFKKIREKLKEYALKDLDNPQNLRKKKKIEYELNDLEDLEIELKEYRIEAIDTLVESAKKEFIEKKKLILDSYNLYSQSTTIYSQPLVKLKEIQQFSIINIYSDKSVVQIEVSGFEVIKTLLEEFVNAALYSKEVMKEVCKDKLNVSEKASHIYKLLPEDVRKDIYKMINNVDFVFDDAKKSIEHFKDLSKESSVELILKEIINGDAQRYLEDIEFLDPIAIYLVDLNIKVNNLYSYEDLKQAFILYKVVITISDYIVGMTDRYATEVFKIVSGQSLH
ncbi:hypothetical protein ABK040_005881 [Willaertia magna]